MDPIHYWLMAREYSIGNAAVAALQFWTAGLEAHILSSTTEQSLQHILLLNMHVPAMPAVR